MCCMPYPVKRYLEVHSILMLKICCVVLRPGLKHSCRLPFLGRVMTRDWVHVVGHSPVCHILLQIVSRTLIVVSPPAFTSSTRTLSRVSEQEMKLDDNRWNYNFKNVIERN